MSNKLDTTVEVNRTLKEQVKELVELNKALQTSISHQPVLRNQNQHQSRNMQSGRAEESDNDEEEEERDEVVILHDSLCRQINDTILSRENIKVRKIWAPDIEKMEEVLDNMDSKVVVLQAFTRDLNKMDMDEMNQKIAGLVSKAVTKADKVVLSTIIRREDVEDIDLKADVVNAFMQLKYKRNENVVVCDNYKLYDSQFRKGDKLHLNDDGTPIFASNLKYAIAEACGVRVIQKRRDFEYRYDDNDRRSGGRGSFRGRR